MLYMLIYCIYTAIYICTYIDRFYIYIHTDIYSVCVCIHSIYMYGYIQAYSLKKT